MPSPHAAGDQVPRPLGHPRLHLRETDSTNDRARELALAGAEHGTLVTASFQTAGRGRQGRPWSAPPGSCLLMSLVLRADPEHLQLLPLTAAVAVCDVAGAHAQIKWPNDVVIASASALGALQRAQSLHLPGRWPETGPGSRRASFAKLAGILIEARPQENWAVLGVGLNVALRPEQLPPALRLTAATLGLGPEAIDPTLERLLTALQRRLAEPRKAVLAAWRARDVLQGREIAWLARGSTGVLRGRAGGIDDAGHLIVVTADGPTSLDAGEVHLEELG